MSKAEEDRGLEDRGLEDREVEDVDKDRGLEDVDKDRGISFAFSDGEKIKRFTELGLGRGIDATRQHSWKNKTSFQVRQVRSNDLVLTEQGGLLQTYEEKVISFWSQQASLKTSINVPQSPVQVGLDAEAYRSLTNTRWIVGKKLTTRTASFSLDFMDRIIDGDYSETELPTMFTRPPIPDAGGRGEIFEQKLCRWIIYRFVREPTDVQSDLSKAVETLKEYVDTKFGAANVEDGRKFLQDNCLSFVRNFGITHFVNSVDLGAVEYQVYTEAEYKKKYGSSAGMGVSQIGNVSVSGEASSDTTHTTMGYKRIGLINKNDVVKRGTHNEAVIGATLLSITCLLQEYELLHQAMREAQQTYFKEKADTTFDPKIITCGKYLFWKAIKVNESEITLEATDDVTQASSFHVNPLDQNDETSPEKFMIMYNDPEDRKLDEANIPPIFRYLETNASFCGYNNGPLHLKYSVNEKESSLEVISRRMQNSATIKTFIGDEEMCYIKISGRKCGYLCIKQIGDEESQRFISAVVPNMSHHNDKTVFMLFRLFPNRLTKLPKLFEKEQSVQ